MHHLWLASVNNISRFLKCINYKHEKCLQPCFTFQLSKTSFGGLNFMKTPITCEERSWKSEILEKSFQINHISRVCKELFGLKSLILRFGLKSRRLDVRHPFLPPTKLMSVQFCFAGDWNLGLCERKTNYVSRRRCLEIKLNI